MRTLRAIGLRSRHSRYIPQFAATHRFSVCIRILLYGILWHPLRERGRSAVHHIQNVSEYTNPLV